jgi:integrase/recombinase XerC
MAVEAIAATWETTSVREARLFAETRLTTRGDLERSSTQGVLAHWRRFDAFLAKGHGITLLSGVTPEVVSGFVGAPTCQGPAAVSTQRGRRSSLRLLFRVLRQYELFDGDPTIDLRLPSRSQVRTRPLTNTEVVLARSASLATLVTTRDPAIWALGEAGASPFEIGRVRPEDVDGDRVWLAGSPSARPRWAELTAWGAIQVARRRRLDLAYLASDRDEPVCGSGVARTLSRILRRAGLGGRPDVGVWSLAGWAGSRLLAEGGIEDVARGLGMRSLDRAAERIGYVWDDAEANL